MKSFTEVDTPALSPLASKAGDKQKLEQRFERILTANSAGLGRVAATYADTQTDREDLLQEIAIAIWKALPAFRGECSERTFAFRIAHNRGIAFLARTQLRLRASLPEREVQDPRPNPETGMVTEQRAIRLRRAVQGLPLLYRQVITLMLEGLDYQEIADVLGISETNVGARLSRARQMLRVEMGKLG